MAEVGGTSGGRLWGERPIGLAAERLGPGRGEGRGTWPRVVRRGGPRGQQKARGGGGRNYSDQPFSVAVQCRSVKYWMMADLILADGFFNNRQFPKHERALCQSSYRRMVKCVK